MKVAIVAAMQEELAPFRQHFGAKQVVFELAKTRIEAVNPPEGTGISQLYLVESGIGKANAAACAAWLLTQVGPDLVINTGSTGSFVPSVDLGDVVISDRFVYSDVDATGFNYAWGQVPQMPADYPVAADLLTNVLAHFQRAGKAYQVHVGTIATSDSFMSDPQRVAEILERQPGLLASDMESAALAQVLATSACQVLNIRGISDHVGAHAPQLFKDSLALAAQNAFDAVLTVLYQEN